MTSITYKDITLFIIFLCSSRWINAKRIGFIAAVVSIIVIIAICIYSMTLHPAPPPHPVAPPQINDTGINSRVIITKICFLDKGGKLTTDVVVAV